MLLADISLQERLRTYAKPIWGYKASGNDVEKELFDGELPEGWVDSPAKVGKRRGRPPKMKLGLLPEDEALVAIKWSGEKERT